MSSKLRWLGGGLALALTAGLGVVLAATANASITEPSATSTATDVTYRFAYAGTPEFTRVYIDTDRDASTGFAQGGAGADFLLENATLYQHGGSGWSWTPVTAVVHTHADGVATWTLPRAAIGETATPGETDLVFQAESPEQTSEKITQGYGAEPPAGGAGATVTYTATDEIIANPERGLYRHAGECDSSAFSEATLRSYRTDAKISLVMCVFYLRGFRAGPIDAATLSHLQKQFDAVRAAGVKMVLRFAYTDSADGADAPTDRVLAHLDQLAPYLQRNADVIEVMQSGFVGAWGEGYYTQNFGNNGVVTAADRANRKAVHDKILQVLPATRMVQLRTPNFKRTMYGTAALTDAQAYDGSAAARTGHHNDCFLADATDQGTYTDTAVEYPYLAAETRYTAMGGETCAVHPARTQCPTATAEMARFHYTYLNHDYHPAVIDGFRTGGCLTTIERQLGYRFTLVDGTYPQTATPGGALPVSLTVRNDGWAAPINPRGAELILRATSTGAVTRLPLAADPRRWAAGAGATVAETLTLPATLAPGSYELLLGLPDPQLPGRPEYAIRTANTGTWEPSTGFNRLGATVTVG
ncbi:hypothetical protein J2S43_001745 [Catenuloplanes nepalensis]|uniref:DUF4832 domain-containing protein n=1 Tax=Catenuloplanes nepalensis TaxID=587533 RepID=A0ABT9MPM3_9ACTN|nr:DUF4832 domain-containing protein [Catenuloplanes nepalensis]MDP9793233.1 hypothetical protein [Catenuloplanes nepalensis]